MSSSVVNSVWGNIMRSQRRETTVLLRNGEHFTGIPEGSVSYPRLRTGAMVWSFSPREIVAAGVKVEDA